MLYSHRTSNPLPGLSRGSVEVTRQAHNLEDAGSNPAPAIMGSTTFTPSRYSFNLGIGSAHF